MNNKYTWQQEQQMLCDAFARALLVEHNIKEVTTQRQAKNGTREFEFPVPTYSKQRISWMKSKNYNLDDLPRLRLATFKTGYVRNQNSCSSNYQINPTYKRKMKCVYMGEDGTYVQEYDTQSRAMIWSEMARLNYMLEFYLRNYKHNTNTNG